VASWNETLGPYKLDGIAFEASTRGLRGGRAVVRRRYPNRDGQDAEDMGREPYVYEVVVPLFHGVDPGHYPDLFDQLRAVLEAPPSSLEYHDPEHGPVIVQVIDWSAPLESGQRDGVILTMTLEERQLDVANLGRVLATQPTDPEELAAQLDDAMSEAGIEEADVTAGFDAAGAKLDLDETGAAGTLWASMVTESLARIDDGAAAIDTVLASVETVRTRLDVLTSLDAAQTADGQPVYEAAVRLASSLQQTAEQLAASAPSLVEHATLIEQSIFEVAAQLYGDPSRVADILARNPMADPLFIPAGTVLVVAER